MRRFRVECNFGCRYFSDAKKAKAYFNKCCSKHLDAEIWIVSYYFDESKKNYFAMQMLLDYSPTSLLKF